MSQLVGNTEDDVSAFFGEPIQQFHEVASAVRQAICHDRFEFAGQIPRQSVTHLDRRGEFRRTMLQHIRQIFTGMAAPTEEQRHAYACPRGDNTGREQTGAFWIVPAVVWPAVVWWWWLPGACSHQFQNPDGRIVVVDDFALERPAGSTLRKPERSTRTRHARCPTERQSGAADVRSGSPAENSTDS